MMRYEERGYRVSINLETFDFPYRRTGNTTRLRIFVVIQGM